VEREAFGYPLTTRVLASLRHAAVIPIDDYKAVFNRPGQRFDKQKNSRKLILAVQRGLFVFEGARVCENYRIGRFFCATQMMNCPYDCEYCYLQGLYPSANIVAFVNIDDYFCATKKILPAYVSLSYEADLLAFEPLFGFVREWTNFAQSVPDLTLEIRTKSVARIPTRPVANVILAWTVTPSPLYEKGAPSLRARLDAVRKAAQDGWNTRLCIDPVLVLPGWQDGLKALLTQAKDINIYDVSIGGFRMSAAHCKKIKRMRPGSVIDDLPLTERDGVVQYPPEILAQINTIQGEWR
jgi:spore photoproduct lyase